MVDDIAIFNEVLFTIPVSGIIVRVKNKADGKEIIGIKKYRNVCSEDKIYVMTPDDNYVGNLFHPNGLIEKSYSRDYYDVYPVVSDEMKMFKTRLEKMRDAEPNKNVSEFISNKIKEVEGIISRFRDNRFEMIKYGYRCFEKQKKEIFNLFSRVGSSKCPVNTREPGNFTIFGRMKKRTGLEEKLLQRKNDMENKLKQQKQIIKKKVIAEQQVDYQKKFRSQTRKRDFEKVIELRERKKEAFVEKLKRKAEQEEKERFEKKKRELLARRMEMRQKRLEMMTNKLAKFVPK